MLLALCAGSLAWGEASAGSCQLDARNSKGIPRPVLTGTGVPADLESNLQRAISALEAGSQRPAAEAAMLRVRDQAAEQHQPCVEGIAEFALGEAAMQSHLRDAPAHFTRAQELLQPIGSPLTLAFVAERIEFTKRFSGDTTAYKDVALKLADDFRAAGDPATGIRVRARSPQLAEDGLQPEALAVMRHELDSIDTPNVPPVRGFIEWAWGSSLRRSGRYDQIAAHFQAAMKDFTACDCETETHAALLLNRAAAADSTGDAESVIQFATEADHLLSSHGLVTMQPQSMRLLASGYAHRKDWPRAIAEYEAALHLIDEQHADAALPNLLLEFADTYGDSGVPQKGLTLLSSRMPAPLTPLQTCSLYGRRSALEDEAGLPGPAIQDAAAARERGCKSLLQQADWAEYLTHESHAFAALHRRDEALASAREAVATIDTQRPRVRTSDAALIEYNQHQNGIYTTLIEALVQSGRAEEALLVSEQGRARAFVDLTSTAAASPGSARPATPRTGTAARPAGADLRSEVHPFTLTTEEIRSTMEQQQTTLVAYWVGGGHLYCWVMAPGKPITVREQPITEQQLTSQVNATLPDETAESAAPRVSRRPMVQTRGGVNQPLAKKSLAAWRGLYQLLVAPIADQLPLGEGALVTIVPHDALFRLSFAALLDPRQRYLVERYTLNETPSVGMLRLAQESAHVRGSEATSKFLVLADPARMPAFHGAPLPPLPGTHLEAQGIRQALTGHDVTLLEGKDASLDRLMAALPGTSVLHLATHAVVSDEAPSTSFLALDANSGTGLLTMSSVYSLHLPGDLVVLSACRTGRGKITSDGVSGLSRAFLFAGASSVITTLWDVVDKPTARLMPRFYTELAAGSSPSVALRKAQLTLLQDLRQGRVRVETLAGAQVSLTEQPAYWAGFTLSGQP